MTLQKKFEQAARATDRYTDIIVKDRVYAAYKQSLDTVRKQTATLYEKHAKGGILSMSEVSKYNRLGNLEKDIAAEMTRLGGKQVRATTQAIKGVYQESAYRTAYALNTEMPDIALNFGLLPTKQVEASVINPINIKWPESVKFNTITATKQIREAITAGIIQGKSYPDVARVIKEKFDMAAYKAERIVRTEAHRARSMGQLATLEEAHEQGVPMLKVWVTAMDDRVRDIHGPMDGQKVEMFDEEGNPGLFWDGNNNKAPAPGMFGVAKSDINCRCAMRGEVPGYEPTERRERLTEEEYQARKAAEAERAAKENRDPLPIARSEVKPYRTYPEYAKEKGFPSLYKGEEPRVVAPMFKTSAEWLSSLDDEQVDVFRKWTTKENYQIADYQRTGVVSDRTAQQFSGKSKEEIKKYLDDRISVMEKALKTAPDYRETVYRGMHNLDESAIEALRSSDTLQFPSFMSADKDAKLAEVFATREGTATKPGVFFEIRKPLTGKDVSVFGKKFATYDVPTEDEQEILFMPGSKFKVVGSEEYTDQRIPGYFKNVKVYKIILEAIK